MILQKSNALIYMALERTGCGKLPFVIIKRQEKACGISHTLKVLFPSCLRPAHTELIKSCLKEEIMQN